jgi:hypothetical protein
MKITSNLLNMPFFLSVWGGNDQQKEGACGPGSWKLEENRRRTIK